MRGQRVPQANGGGTGNTHANPVRTHDFRLLAASGKSGANKIILALFFSMAIIRRFVSRQRFGTIRQCNPNGFQY
jgi:hypothetical protein